MNDAPKALGSDGECPAVHGRKPRQGAASMSSGRGADRHGRKPGTITTNGPGGTVARPRPFARVRMGGHFAGEPQNYPPGIRPRAHGGTFIERNFAFYSFLNRTPGPSPFSSMKITPAASRAARMAVPVSSRPPISPVAASSRLIVGREIPEAFARSDWDHRSKARAAFTCSIDTFSIDRRPVQVLILSVLISPLWSDHNAS